ncbi:MAG: DUF1614 domain-containing protein [Candidatus Binataceae bacterium]|jgi:uncharacterized membrane protein
MFFAPFILIWSILFFFALAFLFGMIEIGIINYAFERAGLPAHLAFGALLASLIGSYINIPVSRIEGGARHPEEVVNYFGVSYRVPAQVADSSTVLAINLGGAVVPVLVSLYLLANQPQMVMQAMLAIAIVAVVVNRFARPIRGLGIATPMLIPPIVAALAAYLLGGEQPGTVAYVSGTIGTLIGADLANLNKLGDLGAPVASIGGAGTFDGIFLTGIVAVLLA